MAVEAQWASEAVRAPGHSPHHWASVPFALEESALAQSLHTVLSVDRTSYTSWTSLQDAALWTLGRVMIIGAWLRGVCAEEDSLSLGDAREIEANTTGCRGTLSSGWHRSQWEPRAGCGPGFRAPRAHLPSDLKVTCPSNVTFII